MRTLIKQPVALALLLLAVSVRATPIAPDDHRPAFWRFLDFSGTESLPIPVNDRDQFALFFDGRVRLPDRRVLHFLDSDTLITEDGLHFRKETERAILRFPSGAHLFLKYHLFAHNWCQWTSKLDPGDRWAEDCRYVVTQSPVNYSANSFQQVRK